MCSLIAEWGNGKSLVVWYAAGRRHDAIIIFAEAETNVGQKNKAARGKSESEEVECLIERYCVDLLHGKRGVPRPGTAGGAFCGGSCS